MKRILRHKTCEFSSQASFGGEIYSSDAIVLEFSDYFKQVGRRCYSRVLPEFIKTFMFMLIVEPPVSLTCMQVPGIKVGRVYYRLLTINYA